MKTVREREFNNAMNSLGATAIPLGKPDLALSLSPLEPLVSETLQIVREKQFDVIFSFHPHETTPKFDHPDHNTAGLVAKYVSAAADVKHLYPEHKAMQERPELYLWTTDKHTATHKKKLTKEMRKRRNKYLKKQYLSQFPKETEREWTGIFDQITTNKKGKHRELYVRVR